MQYLLGLDVGSSSIKACILNAETGSLVASATSPETELAINALQAGWAEQDPQTWWEHACKAVSALRAKGGFDINEVAAIGISYQMHGLVLVDKNKSVLRPAIIWCDSRAVSIGEKAFAALGSDVCLSHLLNSPGNFTASKLKWVQENEPEIYRNIDKMMLPGDYLAMRLTGEIKTTPSGLSEGMLWDFKDKTIADVLLNHYGISKTFIPDIVPTFAPQGTLTAEAAIAMGLKTGTPVTYRGGDQPNNALSLNVLNPGEIAATAGTSGVVYGVGELPNFDPQSRVNTFAHVNYTVQKPRFGVLLCINGCGILNSFIRRTLSTGSTTPLSYDALNALAAQAPIGSDGLIMLPYGNGAERTLGNRTINASVNNLQLNRHTSAHLVRAAQEGIVFALNYGIDIMRSMGVSVITIRAGHANMFLSPLFANAFATLTGSQVELYNTDGAQGAARGAGIGAGIYKTEPEAFTGLTAIKTISPDQSTSAAYSDAYQQWLAVLQHALKQSGI